jgi:hypothetical protein
MCKNITKESIVTARTTMCPSATVPEKLMNVSDESKVLHKGTLTRKTTAVTKVWKTIPCEEALPSTELCSDLPVLVKKSEIYMAPEPRQKAKDVLIAYTILFTENDSNIRQTGIVKHNFET